MATDPSPRRHALAEMVARSPDADEGIARDRLESGLGGETLTYPVALTPGAGGVILVTFPDLAEALTFGWNEVEALRSADDCLHVALRARVRDGRAIPLPSRTDPDGFTASAPKLPERLRPRR